MKMVEVVAEQDPPDHGDVDQQYLGELVGLATLLGIEGPVRSVLAYCCGARGAAFDRIDLAAGRGRIQNANETVLGAMHQLPIHCRHPALAVGLVHGRVDGLLRPSLEGLARLPTLACFTRNDRLAIPAYPVS